MANEERIQRQSAFMAQEAQRADEERQKNFDRAQQVFLTYDQDEMVARLEALSADDSYIYLQFLDLPFRINRTTGAVEKQLGALESSWVPAGVYEAETIWDFCCYSKPGAKPAGAFTGRRPNPFRNTYTYDSQLSPRELAFMNRNVSALQEACRSLGSTNMGSGDVNARFHVFAGIDVLFSFWEGDDEFPACFKYIWDGNIEDFIHFETTYYAQGIVTQRIVENMCTLGAQ